MERHHRYNPRRAGARGSLARELDIRLVDTICVTSYMKNESGGADQIRADVKVLKGVAVTGMATAPMTSLTRGERLRLSASFFRRPILRPYTLSRRAGPLWIPTLRNLSRTSGFSSPGTSNISLRSRLRTGDAPLPGRHREREAVPAPRHWIRGRYVRDRHSTAL